jgi:hypothetical protein
MVTIIRQVSTTSADTCQARCMVHELASGQCLISPREVPMHHHHHEDMNHNQMPCTLLAQIYMVIDLIEVGIS